MLMLEKKCFYTVLFNSSIDFLRFSVLSSCVKQFSDHFPGSDCIEA